MKRSTAALAVLLILAIGVQWWSIEHAVTPALDAVRYVNIAQRFERDGLLSTLCNEPEHPLFPALIWGVHRATEFVVRNFSSGQVGPASRAAPGAAWVATAQWTAAGMLLLSVVSVWFLLRQLVDLPTAIAGTLFFCTLSEIACLGANALSDSTQIFFLSTALWGLAKYWESPLHAASRATCASPVWLFLVGLAAGAALLARPETLVLVPTVVFMTLWFQGHAATQQPWRRLTAAVGCLALGLAVVLLPYFWASDSVTPIAAWGRMLGRDLIESQPKDPKGSGVFFQVGQGAFPRIETVAADMEKDSRPPSPEHSPVPWQLADGEPLSFAIKDSSTTSRFQGHLAATAEFFKELPEAFQYWIGGLAVLGLWCRRRTLSRPFAAFALAYFALHSLATIQHAASGGYLSPRHLSPLVLLGLAPAGCGAWELGRWLGSRLWSNPAGLLGAGPRFWQARGLPHVMGCAVVAIAATACLPRTLAPLHVSRLGHRQAGNWLAASAPLTAVVLDTRGVTGLYSGRTTVRYDAAKAAFEHPELAYIVLEQRELEFDSRRSRTLNRLLEGAAERVAVFESPNRRPQEAVVIYRWYPERFAQIARTPPLTN